MNLDKVDNLKRKAFIDQILMFLMLFVNFVILFFMIIDYSAVMRIKDKIDSMTYYGAKMVGLGRSEDEVAEGLNRIRGNSFAYISGDDIFCEILDTQNHQSIFHIYSNYSNKLIGIDNTSISSKEINYNQMSEFDIECELTLSNI